MPRKRRPKNRNKTEISDTKASVNIKIDFNFTSNLDNIPEIVNSTETDANKKQEGNAHFKENSRVSFADAFNDNKKSKKFEI